MIFQPGELVQIWDAFLEEALNGYYFSLDGFIIPEHGQLGLVLGNPTIGEEYRNILIDGCERIFHIDHLRQVPDELLKKK